MKFTGAIASAVLAVANLAGPGAAYHGVLKSCSHFSIDGLNGEAGRAMMLNADCSGMTKHLDINTCFGWDPAGGNMIMPPSSGFTSFVTECSNDNTGDADFGNKFGCWGPWTGYSNDYYQFALNSFIGLDNGELAC